jgi:hypothetical protein
MTVHGVLWSLHTSGCCVARVAKVTTNTGTVFRHTLSVKHVHRLLSSFWKKKMEASLWDLQFVLVLPNAWTNCYETCYLCRATWDHLNNYFINPSHQSVCLRIPIPLQGNGSVNTFPRRWKIVGVVFYAVRVGSNEITWLFLPRNPLFVCN